MNRGPDDADFELDAMAPDDPDLPRADLTIRLPRDDMVRVRRLFLRLARARKTADRDRVYNGLARILGRETMELIRCQVRADERMEIRLTETGGPPCPKRT